jgi:hypothetical protein
MFNFFRKRKPDATLDYDTLASINYVVDKEGKIIVDVAVSDYDQPSLDALTSILDILSGEKFYFETVNIIKDSLVEAGKSDFLYQIIDHLAKQPLTAHKNTLLSHYEHIHNSTPCIKPSDMLK